MSWLFSRLALLGLLGLLSILPSAIAGTAEDLASAAEQGDLETVKSLLAAGISAERRGRGDKPLQRAVYLKQREMVKVLLSSGEHTRTQGTIGYKVLTAATLNGDIRLAQLLLRYGVRIDGAGRYHESPLQIAIDQGQTVMALWLVHRSASVKLHDWDGHTALMDATLKRQVGLMKELLRRGARVNVTQRHGYTPLGFAILDGDVEAARVLLAAGARLDRCRRDESALMLALEGSEDALIKLIRRKKPSLGERDDLGRTALEREIEAGRLGHVRLLIAHDALRSRQARTGALFKAVEVGSTEALQLVLKTGADPNSFNPEGLTPLFCTRDADILRVLIAAGADVHIRDRAPLPPGLQVRDNPGRRGWTPLMHAIRDRAGPACRVFREAGAESGLEVIEAAKLGDAKALAALLATGADANQSWLRGRTALLEAVESGQLATAQQLLAGGADVHLRSHWPGTTNLGPLAFVAERGDLPMAQALLEAGAEVEERDDFGQTPLMLAAEQNKLPIMAWLVEHGANVQARDRDGAGALTHAAEFGQRAAVEWLLAHGAEVNERSLRGTPLLAAAEQSRTEVVKALLAAGADVNARDGNGRTALLRIVRTAAIRAALLPIQRVDEDATVTAQVLLDHEADLNVRDNSGRTALDLAIARGYRPLAELLRARGARSAHGKKP